MAGNTSSIKNKRKNMVERLIYKNSTEETKIRYEMTQEEFEVYGKLKDENRKLREIISNLTSNLKEQ